MNLILPPKKLILPPPLTRRHGLAGEYRFTILDGATKAVKRETDWMPNLITDIGLDRIGTTSAGVGSYCRIGTGNTTPTFGDTALQAQYASTSSVVANSAVNAGASNYETQYSLTYQFALGAVVGNMAEIGVGWSASTASTLFSRALIVTGGGTPTTITVLVTEILQVTYRITLYPDVVDGSGSVVIGADTFNYTSRIYNASTQLGISPLQAWLGQVYPHTAFTDTMSALTGTGPTTGTSTALTLGSYLSYTPGTYYLDYTISAAIGVGNLTGGIRTITCNVGGLGGTFSYTQLQFANAVGGGKILKDNTKAFGLTLRQAWARH